MSIPAIALKSAEGNYYIALLQLAQDFGPAGRFTVFAIYGDQQFSSLEELVGALDKKCCLSQPTFCTLHDKTGLACAPKVYMGCCNWLVDTDTSHISVFLTFRRDVPKP